MSRYPFTLRKRFSASRRPAAIQRTTILPFFQRLTLPVTSRAMEIIDSIGLVDLKVSSKLPLRPSRVTASVSYRLYPEPQWVTIIV